jgi:hypothetical protein
MKIIRNFELLGLLRPVKIKQNGKLLGRLSSFQSAKTIPLASQDQKVDISFDCFKQSIELKDDSVILVRHNKYFSALGLMAWISFALAVVFWNKNDIMDICLLILPAVYLLAMVYFALFDRKGFLKIESI